MRRCLKLGYQNPEKEADLGIILKNVYIQMFITLTQMSDSDSQIPFFEEINRLLSNSCFFILRHRVLGFIPVARAVFDTLPS